MLGALKRLYEWEGARIQILTTKTASESAELQTWVDLLGAQVVNPGGEELNSTLQRHLWQGTVNLTGAQVGLYLIREIASQFHKVFSTLIFKCRDLGSLADGKTSITICI